MQELPHTKHDGYITLEVRVQPRASRQALEVTGEGTIKARLTAPPAEGEANRQLIALIAKHLKTPKGSVSIIKGLSSRNKVVRVETDHGAKRGAPPA